MRRRGRVGRGAGQGGREREKEGGGGGRREEGEGREMTLTRADIGLAVAVPIAHRAHPAQKEAKRRTGGKTSLWAVTSPSQNTDSRCKLAVKKIMDKGGRDRWWREGSRRQWGEGESGGGKGASWEGEGRTRKGSSAQRQARQSGGRTLISGRHIFHCSARHTRSAGMSGDLAEVKSSDGRHDA
eukprot:740507-Rhodomonas_salina.1